MFVGDSKAHFPLLERSLRTAEQHRNQTFQTSQCPIPLQVRYVLGLRCSQNPPKHLLDLQPIHESEVN